MADVISIQSLGRADYSSRKRLELSSHSVACASKNKTTAIKGTERLTADSDDSAVQALFRVVRVAPPSSFYSCSFFSKKHYGTLYCPQAPNCRLEGRGGAASRRVSFRNYCVGELLYTVEFRNLQ